MKYSSLLCLSLLFENALPRNADESPTGALLKFPVAPQGSILDGVEFEVAPSQFGFHDYGGSLEGFLVLPMNTSYHLECVQEPIGSDGPENEYIHYVEDWDPDDDSAIWIMVIDRGDCYFVEKVENAQALGAAGVIVIDNRYEGLFTMWPPENWDDDIDIPSVLLRRSDGDTMMEALGVQNWDPNNIDDTIYPDPNHSMNATIGKIEWGLPHEDDRVEWEMWTSGNDEGGVEFKKNFADTAVDLDYRNYTVFTPHYYILNGTHWNCDTNRLRCSTQCTNMGRYCAPDPEYDLEIGLDGMDVVRESLRQLCIWDYIQQDELRNDTLWWHYSILWDHFCFLTNDSNTFTEDCSYHQMEKFTEYPDLVDYVHQCINDSGGYDYRGGENHLLASESRLREKKSVFALPTIIVNEYWVHGNIDCEEVTEEGCQVLDAICAGFLEGTEPEECYFTPSPTAVTCPDEYRDCQGECYGDYRMDSCGHCNLVTDPDWNACVGCDGVANSSVTYDCMGVCGGNYKFNPCSFCMNSSDPEFSTYGKDCKGDCNTGYEMDECGDCTLPSDILWNKCVGCDGVPNSGVTYDCTGTCGGSYANNPCGFCMNATDPQFDSYGTDCLNICGGDYVYDRCDQCLPTYDDAFDDCLDDGNNSSSSDTNTTVVIVIAIIAVLVIILAGAIIYRLWKRQKHVDERFSTIMKTYQLMDENPRTGTEIPEHSIPEDDDDL